MRSTLKGLSYTCDRYDQYRKDTLARLRYERDRYAQEAKRARQWMFDLRKKKDKVGALKALSDYHLAMQYKEKTIETIKKFKETGEL